MEKRRDRLRFKKIDFIAIPNGVAFIFIVEYFGSVSELVLRDLDF